MANPVYDRAYAQNRADGTPAPTMNYLNPQWAQFYDRIKQATGGKSTVLNGGVGQTMPPLGSAEDPAAPDYGQGIKPLTASMSGLQKATKVRY